MRAGMSDDAKLVSTSSSIRAPPYADKNNTKRTLTTCKAMHITLTRCPPKILMRFLRVLDPTNQISMSWGRKMLLLTTLLALVMIGVNALPGRNHVLQKRVTDFSPWSDLPLAFSTV